MVNDTLLLCTCEYILRYLSPSPGGFCRAVFRSGTRAFQQNGSAAWDSRLLWRSAWSRSCPEAQEVLQSRTWFRAAIGTKWKCLRLEEKIEIAMIGETWGVTQEGRKTAGNTLVPREGWLDHRFLWKFRYSFCPVFSALLPSIFYPNSSHFRVFQARRLY